MQEQVFRHGGSLPNYRPLCVGSFLFHFMAGVWKSRADQPSCGKKNRKIEAFSTWAAWRIAQEQMSQFKQINNQLADRTTNERRNQKWPTNIGRQ